MDEAQVHGVRVVMVAVPNADDEPHGVSRHLVRAADELDVLPGDLIDNAVMKVEVPRPAAPVPVAPTPRCRSGAARVLAAFQRSATPADIAELRRGKPSIPRDIDRALLIDASEALGMYDISERIRYRLRERFWLQLDRQD